ncbi:MAG: class I SAM-dependent methyltransferase [Planctomycetota bacterium]
MSGDERIEGEARERFLRGLQAEAADRGDPIGWFEPLYAKALEGQVDAPWEDGQANPMLREWLEIRRPDGRGKRALEVGCGYGHGARLLVESGYRVDAVDLSASAIALARQHNSHPAIDFAQADMLEPPPEFEHAFDLIVEIYTLQAIPEDLRQRLTRVLPRCLAPGGELLVICRARDEQQPAQGPPWPLAESEIRALTQTPEGLKLVQLERFHDGEDPPRDRFRALLRAPN